MRASRLPLFLGLILALTACGKQQAADEQQQAATTPATALAPPADTAAPTATASQREAAGLAPTAPSRITRPNEDGSETIEETTGDNGTQNPLLAAVASTMAATTSAASAAATGPTLWQEGVNYTRLVPAQPTSVAAGQVEVLEFFWYGCPHCNAIDPLIESWKKTKPGFISFSRVPVMWSEAHRSTARLYYTLESMGKLDQMHAEVFKEIHVNGNPLIASDPNDTAGAERIQTAFVKKFGISEDAFKKAYHSFSVETALQRADQLVMRYRIEGVPSIVVNGKYVADVRSAGSAEKLVSLVDDLATQEHKH
ncbi:MAG TPA: thiol:disulfide interchange protein DsbA/DsbL [Steroidobacteraceae bacterium]